MRWLVRFHAIGDWEVGAIPDDRGRRDVKVVVDGARSEREAVALARFANPNPWPATALRLWRQGEESAGEPITEFSRAVTG
jgi:hypothetical protein